MPQAADHAVFKFLRPLIEALGVAKGDAVTGRKSLVALGPHRATARSIDDRNGVAALVAALNRIDPAKIPNTVTVSFLAHIPLGSGAVARAIDNSSITPAATVARILEIARARKIPISVGTTNGGNDGSSFSRYGSIVAPLSWPGRYSHSPVEVMDVRDLDALVQLIVAIASEPRF